MLTVTRTANAGVLLELDGKRILLDGVCGEIAPYLPTPEKVKAALRQNYPDLVAVTHRHMDHCDPSFEADYEKNTGRKTVDPTFVGSAVYCGSVRIMPVASRHIGKADCDHASFILEGSRCVWFMGDASPNQWKNRTDLPKPDLLIAPFAYASTPSGWKITQSLGAKAVLLVHMPDRAQDPVGLWPMVEQTVGAEKDVFIPQMEEFVKFDF